MQTTAFHVDTCFSDYLQDSYSREGQTLCLSFLGLSKEDTVSSLFDSINWHAVPEALGETVIRIALGQAIEHSDLRYIDEDGNPCDEIDEDRDSEEPYIYVCLDWRGMS